MQTKIIVNSIKDGQDRNIALLTNVGNIVELRYNAEIKQVEFYRNNGYLGALPSKEKLEGFAQVMKIENLFKGFHFTFCYYEGLTEEEMLQKEQKYNEQKRQRKEAIREEILRDKEAREAKEEKLKQNSKLPTFTKENIIYSNTFVNLVKAYYFQQEAKKDSIGSSLHDLGSIFNVLFMDYKAPTKEEEFYAWWKDHLKQSQNSDEGRFLIQLNESGNLMPLVQQYKAKIIPSPTSFF